MLCLVITLFLPFSIYNLNPVQIVERMLASEWQSVDFLESRIYTGRGAAGECRSVLVAALKHYHGFGGLIQFIILPT